jgi:methylated-DNA-[protein]-cysteine S-methyltransferase
MRVYYDSIDTPIGKLTVGVCSWGVRWVLFADEVGDQFGADAQHDTGATRFAIEQLAEYFAGTRQVFELPIAWNLLQGFSVAVWQAMAAIPYGETASYGDIAERASSPNASRAVGNVCGNNPLLLLVPCHRVVTSHGGLGGFRGGVDTKAALLAHEGVLLPLQASPSSAASTP